MRTYAIASVLNCEICQIIPNLWDDLQQHCQIKSVKQSPIPHFSWLVFKTILDSENLQIALSDWVKCLTPFRVRFNGLGIFPGENPILYLPVVRTGILSELQEDLIQRISPYLDGISHHYLPDSWLPHATLAIHDLDQHNIHCAIDQCQKVPLLFDLNVDHIAILYLDESSFGVTHKFSFHEC